jgi:hypothetical protein
LSVVANTAVLAAPVFCPISTTYSLIFVPVLPDDGRLCKGAPVVLVVLLYILPAFEASPFRARLVVGGDADPLRGVRLAIRVARIGHSTSEEDMVRGMKIGARWEEIVDRWPFRKGVDPGTAPGLHLH